nr:hypothetical protein Iba_chr06dCG9680 [Ipomoea batatas]
MFSSAGSHEYHDDKPQTSSCESLGAEANQWRQTVVPLAYQEQHVRRRLAGLAKTKATKRMADDLRPLVGLQSVPGARHPLRAASRSSRATTHYCESDRRQRGKPRQRRRSNPMASIGVVPVRVPAITVVILRGRLCHRIRSSGIGGITAAYWVGGIIMGILSGSVPWVTMIYYPQEVAFAPRKSTKHTCTSCRLFNKAHAVAGFPRSAFAPSPGVLPRASDTFATSFFVAGQPTPGGKHFTAAPAHPVFLKQIVGAGFAVHRSGRCSHVHASVEVLSV